MDQQKIGNFIKELRKEHHLSQGKLAEILGVTSQAVSKWENGKNIPDVATMKIISDKFDVNIDEIINGKKEKPKKKSSKLIIILGIILLVIALVIILLMSHKEDYKFKILSSNCDNFNISGNISYNSKKSSIYINRIEYCGGDDNTKYKNIKCVLYEKNKDTYIKISEAESKDNIKLETYLKNVEFTIDNYLRICKDYSDKNLYLEISALKYDDKVISYKVPLKINEACNKYMGEK